MAKINYQHECSKFRSQVGGVSTTLTTLQFGQIIPICAHAIKPLDTWRVTPHIDLKLASLSVPTRAKMYFNTAAFYVPYSILDKCFSPMIAEKEFYQGLDCKRGLYFRKCDIDNLHVSQRNNGFNNYVHRSVTSECEYHSIKSPSDFRYLEVFDTASPSMIDCLSNSRTSLHVYSADSGDVAARSLDLIVDGASVFKTIQGERLSSDQQKVNAWLLVYDGERMYDVEHKCRYTELGTSTPYAPLRDFGFQGNIFLGYKTFKDIRSLGIKYDVLVKCKLSNGTFTYFPLSYSQEFKRYIKIFNALGYQNSLVCADVVLKATDIPSFVEPIMTCSDTSMYGHDYDSSHKISAYPLLSYLKAYADYFSNPNRNLPLRLMLDNIRDHVVSQKISSKESVESVQQRNVYVISDTSGSVTAIDNHLLSWDYVFKHLADVKLFIRPDDVTRCTNDFFRVDEQTNSSSILYKRGLSRDSLEAYNRTEVDSNGTVLLDTQLPTESSPFYTKLVQSVAKHLMLNRVVGSRLIDKFRAQFGVAPTIEEDFRCKYLGMNRTPIDIAQVNLTADGYNDGKLQSNAGDYVGQGFAKHQSTYVLQSGKEFGYAFCVAWLTCIPVYQSRMDRELFKYLPKDWYDETYDGLGYAQPKIVEEVATNSSAVFSEETFGFEPVYEEYTNVCRDIVTGDFRSKAGYEAWFTPRNFEDVPSSELVAQSDAVLTYSNDTDEYNKMFQIAPSNYDPFLLFCQIEISANRAKAPTEASLGIDSGNLTVDENGNFIC